MAALDGRPGDDARASTLPANASVNDLAIFAAVVLDRFVTLSARFEVQDDGGDTAAAYYVIPAT
jgi:hypothetical protein